MSTKFLGRLTGPFALTYDRPGGIAWGFRFVSDDTTVALSFPTLPDRGLMLGYRYRKAKRNRSYIDVFFPSSRRYG